MNRSSPMMEQYRAIKEQHPDKLLMFQVGDFYELFFDDARVAARDMEIALTSRDAGSDDPIPLAGIPIHSAETYLNKLLTRGHRVVICEQVENAAQAKGLVRREITRILTPGTVINPELLEESRNNYLAAIVSGAGRRYGLAAVDVSTGDFRITEQEGEGAFEIIGDELERYRPAELICSSPALENLCRRRLGSGSSMLIEIPHRLAGEQDARIQFIRQWGEETWRDLDLDRYPLAARAAAAALTYLLRLRQLPEGSDHFRRPDLYFSGSGMVIDSITSRNLELTRSLGRGGKEGSLLGLIDRCMTAMGRRLLRRRLEEPLLSLARIEKRLDAVEELVRKPLERGELRRLLGDLFDLERFCGRLSYDRVNARDLAALRRALRDMETLREKTGAFETGLLDEIKAALPLFKELQSLLHDALVEDPPQALREGGIIREGYNKEADRLRQLSQEGTELLLRFEQEEKERTGIKSLRVGFNRNFGYYIEVTRANLELVPEDYQRKQTLVNAERFTKMELQQLENQITGARDRLATLEYSLFEELRSTVAKHRAELLAAAHQVARLDYVQGLAEAAEKYRYCRPAFSKDGRLSLKETRHPVVERMVGERFVPNDLEMDRDWHLLVITGPNMAGKSTYIRSAALTAIMAQMGSFVPAREALLPLFDRLFARVGAGDDLSRGQSTFMVEMQETAMILKEASAQSLIILDEIGRGTSTYDGLSIAQSVLEFISRRIKAKTLFSTHYHELTNMEGELPGVKNYTMAAREKGKEVIFLHRVVPGRADKSYGINVARLAGVPIEVLVRAEAILSELELAASNHSEQQLSLLPLMPGPRCNHRAELETATTLRELDLNRLTPLEAMQKLYELQQMLEAEEAEEITVKQEDDSPDSN